jgi:hypothetical protein
MHLQKHKMNHLSLQYNVYRLRHLLLLLLLCLLFLLFRHLLLLRLRLRLLCLLALPENPPKNPNQWVKVLILIMT